MEKEELLLPVQTSMKNSHRLSYSTRYTSTTTTPTHPATSTAMEEKQRKEKKEKHIKKEEKRRKSIFKKRKSVVLKQRYSWSIVFITRSFQVDGKKKEKKKGDN